MNSLRQAPTPNPLGRRVRVWLPLLLLFLMAACDGAPKDLCQVDPPEDEAAYRAQVETARTARDRYFRESAESPVPEKVRQGGWSGLEYFEVDPRLRVVGPLVRKTSGRRFEIATTAGDLRPCVEVGYFLVDFGAGAERLPVYELTDQADAQRGLFVPFMDSTTGTDTYFAGRYLEVEALGRGQFRLDFNAAYNPSCAYGGTFQCPITPEENRLAAAIRAGERGWVHTEDPSEDQSEDQSEE